MPAQTQSLYDHVAFLTTLNPARNYRNLQSLEQAYSYIHTAFSKLGITPAYQVWQAGGQEYRNVIATYNAGKPKKLVVGAHYDVAGEQPGADDNASAVAGLLELARMVFSEKPVVDYSIEFVAYCLEEPPFFATDFMGSYVHAKSLYDSKTELIGMISLEMIGYFSDEPGSQPFPSPELAKLYPHTANFIIVVGIERFADFNNKVHSLMSAEAEIDVQAIAFPSGETLAGLSDQRSYWRFGYNALMINDTSFIRNPNYHKASDTIDTLDFEKMRAVVDCCYRAIKGL